MIDLESLDARLDMALAEELRVRRAPIADIGRPAVAPDVLPPAPESVPAPEAPRRGRSTVGGPSSRSRPSPASLSGVSCSPLAPPETVWDDLDIDQHGRAVVDLISQAKLAEADLHRVVHAELAQRCGHSRHRCEAAGWAVMQALLVGRESTARAALDQAARLDPEGGTPDHQDRCWSQRLAVALAWGGDNERYDVVDHCRERAYGHGDVAWQGRLALLLAVLGRGDEAGREFDSGIGTVLNASTRDAGWLDLATDLAEAAAVLGDGHRGDLARQGLAQVGPASLVIAGRAWVCKGSVARYQALAIAAAGHVDESDAYFRAAAETHRRLGAQVLLARTLGDWGFSLAERDPRRGAHLQRESAEMSRRLGLVAAHPAVADVA